MVDWILLSKLCVLKLKEEYSAIQTIIAASYYSLYCDNVLLLFVDYGSIFSNYLRITVTV